MIAVNSDEREGKTSTRWEFLMSRIRFSVFTVLFLAALPVVAQAQSDTTLPGGAVLTVFSNTPKGAVKPAVLYLGTFGNKPEQGPSGVAASLFKILSKDQIDAAYLNYRGWGKSALPSTDSTFMYMIEDAKQAVKSLSLSADGKSRKVGIIGFDLGAAVGALVAADPSMSNVASVVLLGPSFALNPLFSKIRSYSSINKQGSYAFSIESDKPFTISPKFFTIDKKTSLEQAYQNIKTPWMLIYGETDPLIKVPSSENSQKTYLKTEIAQLINPPKVKIIKWLDHNFSTTSGDRGQGVSVATAAAQFTEKTLEAAQNPSPSPDTAQQAPVSK